MKKCIDFEAVFNTNGEADDITRNYDEPNQNGRRVYDAEYR
jgi:hypothetical protein